MAHKYLSRILVVEDEPTNLEIIRCNLADDYLVSTATTKEEAIQKLLNEDFCLALLDIGLPDGSGLDICREVKNDPERYGEIQVIFITGMDSPNDEVNGLRYGASDYISKPIHSSVLKARVELQMQLIRKTQLLAQLARIDGLTELSNARAFEDHLDKSWNHAKRISAPLSLAYIEVDHFKHLNEFHGHPAGDYCLKQLAYVLQSKIKRGSDHVARIVGERFAVMLFDCDKEQAQEVLARITEAFDSLGIEHKRTASDGKASISVGLCTAFPEIDVQEEFQSATERLLCEAKRVGFKRSSASHLQKMT